MNEGDQLLLDIIANPEDDGLRLICADWLEDHGYPDRAEFIRVQIALAKLPECGHDYFNSPPVTGCEYCRLALREEAIMDANDNFLDWCEPIDRSVGSGEHVIFRRGFIDEVHARFDTLWTKLAAIVKRHPITQVRPTDKTPACSPYDEAYWVDQEGLDFKCGPACLPSAFFPEVPYQDYREFKSTQEAFDWLSKRLLQMAKSQPKD